jgi:hypothetical protein
LRSLFLPSQSPPSHPVVIRVQERIVRGSRIDTSRRVDKMILGSRVQGTSRTKGTVQVDLSQADRNAAFYVVFRGQTRTNTVGHNGPALIDSQTQSDFSAARRITFTPLEGFKSEPTSLRSTTRLVIDGVRSTRPGLRGKIVRRIALRRAQDSRSQAERIAYNDARREIQHAFDRSLDARVARLNRRANAARYLVALLERDPERLAVQVDSTDDCVQFAIGPEASQAERFEVLSQPPGATPLEIWVHSSVLKERLPALTEAFALVADPAHPMRATLPMLQALSISQEDSPDSPVIRIQNDWVVLALDPNEQDPLIAQQTEDRIQR